MLSRRELLRNVGVGSLAWALGSGEGMTAFVTTPGQDKTVRSINVINFLRGVEPRGPVDLFLPLQKQMEISLQHGLPTTWLLQYDALVSGPFVEYLKEHKAPSHEVGIWFEMNEPHCREAGVEWRGRPGYSWDHYPFVAFTIGYTPEERIKLADAFMRKFREVWGFHPKSVASWNLDSITMAHLCEEYGVDAFAVCRDQIATDGFTIWGAPIAGYYPSKTNCWSPGRTADTQLPSPVFRMLGQDPVYYYFRHGYPMPDGQRGSGPDTMEPVWPSGRSKTFIKNFLHMISDAPTLDFAYAQLGQENNFGWPDMEAAYLLQMQALADLRATGKVHVETMGDTGRRFKESFEVTPAQAQVMLVDSFGNTDPEEKSIWYQSRFYRANLHLHGDLPFLRDLTVYSDANEQPFLKEPTRAHDVEQRMPPVLDGYHWSTSPGSAEPGAGGFFLVEGERLRLTGEPKVEEGENALTVRMPVTGGRTLEVKFEEEAMQAWLHGSEKLTLSLEWDAKHEVLAEVAPNRAAYRVQDFDYAIRVHGTARRTPKGWEAASREDGLILLWLAQYT